MSSEKIINDIKSLTLKDKDKIRHRLLFESIVRDEQSCTDWLIDWIEQNSIVNRKDTGESDISAIISMAKVSTALLSQVAANQARQEMQAMSEHSLFGMQLADKLSDLAAEAIELINEASAISAHYQTVLAGRRSGIHFTDGSGTSKCYSDDEKRAAQSVKGFRPEILKGKLEKN